MLDAAREGVECTCFTRRRTELDQIEDYANAILNDPQFSSSTAHWDLILVATSIDDVVRNRIQDEDFELGRLWGPRHKPGQPRVTAYVRSWRDIIDENKRRLDFVASVGMLGRPDTPSRGRRADAH